MKVQNLRCSTYTTQQYSYYVYALTSSLFTYVKYCFHKKPNQINPRFGNHNIIVNRFSSNMDPVCNMLTMFVAQNNPFILCSPLGKFPFESLGLWGPSGYIWRDGY